jgi:hypothetical protein
LTDTQTIGQRLEWLLSELNLGINEFATTIKVDGSQFGKIINNKLGITLKQILEISSVYGVRPGWLIDGELPVYKKEKSGPNMEPDHLLTLRKQISTALVSLQEAMKTLPQPLGPEISVAGDPAFRQSGKTKKTEKQ